MGRDRPTSVRTITRDPPTATTDPEGCRPRWHPQPVSVARRTPVRARRLTASEAGRGPPIVDAQQVLAWLDLRRQHVRDRIATRGGRGRSGLREHRRLRPAPSEIAGRSRGRAHASGNAGPGGGAGGSIRSLEPARSASHGRRTPHSRRPGDCRLSSCVAPIEKAKPGPPRRRSPPGRPVTAALSVRVSLRPRPLRTNHCVAPRVRPLPPAAVQSLIVEHPRGRINHDTHRYH